MKNDENNDEITRRAQKDAREGPWKESGAVLVAFGVGLGIWIFSLIFRYRAEIIDAILQMNRGEVLFASVAALIVLFSVIKSIANSRMG